MGKSASGKDSLYKKILSSGIKLNRVVLYTTRPMRDGEKDGREYHFVDKNYLDKNSDKIIEERVYKTVYGDWYYATIDDGSIKDNENYLIIGTLESYNMLKKYFGEDYIFPIYLEVDNETRLKRARDRENMQQVPKIEEMNRRFAADEIDFSEENILKANIKKRYINNNFSRCYKQILRDIRSEISKNK